MTLHQMKIIVVVAPKKELYPLLEKFAKPLKCARVLGVLGEDVVESKLCDLSHKRPVLVGVAGATLADEEVYKTTFERLTTVFGSGTAVLIPYNGAPRLLSKWLEEFRAHESYEQMVQYARQYGRLLEYVRQTSLPYQSKLVWVEREGSLLTALGLQEAYVDPQGHVTLRCRASGASEREDAASQAAGIAVAEQKLIAAFDAQLQMRNQASRGILNPYNRGEPSYAALLAERRYVPLEAHRPSSLAYESIAARLLLPR